MLTWRVDPACHACIRLWRMVRYVHLLTAAGNAIPRWPLPAVRDLARDGRWSTYDESVHNLSNASFRGKCARMENSLNKPSQQNLPGWVIFLPRPPGGAPCRPGVLLYVYVFSLGNAISSQLSSPCQMLRSGKADGTNSLSQYKSHLPGNPLRAKLHIGRTLCMASPP